jgi:hypothetical protein
MSDPDALYAQLGLLIKSMPDLLAWPTTDDTNHWLARAFSLLELTNVTLDASDFKAAIVKVNSPNTDMRKAGATMIKLILFRAFHRTERKVSGGLSGAFIPVGDAFEALVAVGNVLGSATSDVLIIDPYADIKLLDEYARPVPDGIASRDGR